MKLNKSTLRNIVTIFFVILAVAMFLHDEFSAPAAAEPDLPQSSQAVTLPEEESPEQEEDPSLEDAPEEDSAFAFDVLDENGSYTSMEDVADYIHIFGRLPRNYITKNEARDLGWESSEGNLWEVAPGTSIGGDRFGNYEELLPDADGRTWTECDIDYEGGHRNAKRIVFSNDGLIFYTDDHYETFTQLY